MSRIYHYATVIDALADLKEKGYNVDFNLAEQDIVKNPYRYSIEHVYRYEGNTNPDDEAVVYGIKSSNGSKGVFVAGFSANSEGDAAQVLNQMSSKI
jgi:hypothetical protein